MSYDESELYRGQPGTTDTLLYTVPAATTAIVASIVVTNTTSSAATLTLALDAGGAITAANSVLAAESIPANTSLPSFPLREVLATGDTIRALQGTASALTVHIAGILIT